jgi:SAM-dependent methyltransferase
MAIDLGCGGGTDALALLARGWAVTAIDQDEAGLRLLREAIPEASAGRVTIARAEFAELPLPSAGLVHAGFSLPFCAPGDFAGVWRGIRAALVPGGVFAGQLFGPRDSWAQSARMSFHRADQVEELLSGTEVLFLEESAWDGEAFSGPKRWHVFNIMFRQPLLAGLEPQGAAQALGGGMAGAGQSLRLLRRVVAASVALVALRIAVGGRWP